MKLNPKALRYMDSDDFRVLTAVEMGMKNHECVPTTLIAQLANMKHGGLNRIIGELARVKLIARLQNMKYDGYRLTYGGYDFLALKTFTKRKSVHSVGQQIGIGKESDVHLVADEDGTQFILKLQRLGRVSFRTIHRNRDYYSSTNNNVSSFTAHWFHISRLAALKEYTFLKMLYEHDFPVPKPIDYNRHAFVMELIHDGVPLYHLKRGDVRHRGLATSHDEPTLEEELEAISYLFHELMALIVRLGRSGLIHGDFNEFNLLVRSIPPEENNEAERPPLEVIMIDFPQMISTSHENAAYYFDRDVHCVRTFFEKRFAFIVDDKDVPQFDPETMVVNKEKALDVLVEASGFTKKQQRDFEMLTQTQIEQNQDDSDSTEYESESSQESEKSELSQNLEETENDANIQHDWETCSVVTNQTYWDNHKHLPLRDSAKDISDKVPFDPLAYRKQQYEKQANSLHKDIQHRLQLHQQSTPQPLLRKIQTRNIVKSKDKRRALASIKQTDGW